MQLTSIDVQLNALLADSERSKLIKKLSEANQQNRFLKRQVRLLNTFYFMKTGIRDLGTVWIAVT